MPLSPADAAPTRTAAALGAACGPSPSRGSGTSGRSRPSRLQHPPPPPAPGLCPQLPHLLLGPRSLGLPRSKQVCPGGLCDVTSVLLRVQKAPARPHRRGGGAGEGELVFGRRAGQRPRAPAAPLPASDGAQAEHLKESESANPTVKFLPPQNLVPTRPALRSAAVVTPPRRLLEGPDVSSLSTEAGLKREMSDDEVVGK